MFENPVGVAASYVLGVSKVAPNITSKWDSIGDVKLLQTMEEAGC